MKHGNDKGGATSRYRVALVITRSLDVQENIGRIKTLRQICAVLEAEFTVSRYRLLNLLETRRLGDFAGAFARAIWALVCLRPLPLQSVLYSSGREIRQLRNDLREQNFDAIYLDSVRAQMLFRSLQKVLPSCRFVVDLDDLMSRRMELTAESGQAPSFGYLRDAVPAPLRRLIETPLSRWLCRYEAAALNRAEVEIARAAQAVVLVSTLERNMLRDRLQPAASLHVRAIPPPALAVRDPDMVAGYRFTFIGSDKLLQNRLSIDYLIGLWQRLGLSRELHIYGRQERPPTEMQNVVWHGYVENLAEVYTRDSILLLPVLVPGGIKTKAIEAWSYGRPVLGNPIAFEGLSIEAYPLAVALQDWSDYLSNPAKHRDKWISAARMGNAFVRDALSTERYAAAWASLFKPNGALRMKADDAQCINA